MLRHFHRTSHVLSRARLGQPSPARYSTAAALEEFEKLKQRRDEEIRKSSNSGVTFQPWQPLKEIGAKDQHGSDNPAVAAELKGQLWPLTYPMASPQHVVAVPFDTTTGRAILEESGKFALTLAVKRVLGIDSKPLGGGPYHNGGFFVDLEAAGAEALDSTSMQELQRVLKQLLKKKEPFESVYASPEEAAALLAAIEYDHSESYHGRHRDSEHGSSQSDPLLICKLLDHVGVVPLPLVPHTGYLGGLQVIGTSGSHTHAGGTQGSFTQRVFGVAFPTKALYKEWNAAVEEAAKRDHRVIGKSQELWTFQNESVGSAFMLPHGMRIYNALMRMLRHQYSVRGYEEVRRLHRIAFSMLIAFHCNLPIHPRCLAG